MDVKGFFEEYRFLSNFWRVPVKYNGKEYPTVEHAYQAAKSLSHMIREEIRSLEKPGEAKRRGAEIQLRANWEEIKLEIMEDLIYQKFSVPKYKEKLLATGDGYIEETNKWEDTYWGVCNGKGENILGKIIMKVRDRLNE